MEKTAQVAIPFLWGTSSATATPAAIDSSNLALRFENDLLKEPPVSMGSELNGIDNFYFPSFMKGTWQIQQTLVGVSTPLGLAYAGGPNGEESIARQTLQDAQTRLNVPVQLQLRFLSTPWGVAEDRPAN